MFGSGKRSLAEHPADPRDRPRRDPVPRTVRATRCLVCPPRLLASAAPSAASPRVLRSPASPIPSGPPTACACPSGARDAPAPAPASGSCPSARLERAVVQRLSHRAARLALVAAVGEAALRRRGSRRPRTSREPFLASQSCSSRSPACRSRSRRSAAGGAGDGRSCAGRGRRCGAPSWRRPRRRACSRASTCRRPTTRAGRASGRREVAATSSSPRLRGRHDDDRDAERDRLDLGAAASASSVEVGLRQHDHGLAPLSHAVVR